MTKLNSRQVLLCCFSVLVLAQSGCHAIPHSGSPTACDSLPTPCGSVCCDSMPCDGGCDVCCDDPGFDACDADPGIRSRQVVRGRPIRFLDECGSVFGFVNKLALWDKRADNHRVSRQTEGHVASYLRRNRLNSVLVRSNQYDPIGEWGRLVANKRMAAPWKYTFGTYGVVKYALLPGRLIGGDWYNPFTDTVHLYSDIPSLGLAKAAYAKDVHSRSLQGTYAAGQTAPVLGLWHESLANQEVFRYLGRSGSKAQVSEAKRILIPDLGGSVGSQVLGVFPFGSVYGRAAGALSGHAYRGLTQANDLRQASAPGDAVMR